MEPGSLQIESLNHLIEEASQKIEQRAEQDPQAQLLRTIPGVGYYTALLLIAELGDVARFPTAKHVVAYHGLTPRVWSSRRAVHIGRISRQGSAYLR